MKKPSTRIHQIAEEWKEGFKDLTRLEELSLLMDAVISYLDEEHAKDLELADFTKSGERRE